MQSVLNVSMFYQSFIQ